MQRNTESVHSRAPAELRQLGGLPYSATLSHVLNLLARPGRAEVGLYHTTKELVPIGCRLPTFEEPSDKKKGQGRL